MEYEYAILALGGFLVGLMRSGFGGGVGVVATPVLALALPAKMALGVILPLTLTADVISVRYYWGHWAMRKALPLLPGMALGVVLGWGVLDALPEEWFRRMVGVLACVFGLLQVFRDRLPVAREKPSMWAGVAAGVAMGVVSTLIHAGGVVMMLYLLPQGFSGRSFVATAWVLGVLVNLLKLVPYLEMGLIGRESLMLDLWMLPGLAAGALAGIFLNHRLPLAWFNRAILVIVLAVGFKLVVS